MANTTNDIPTQIPRVETEDAESDLYIVYQEPGGALVQSPAPSSYERFLEFIHTRGIYGDGDYPKISENLRAGSALSLLASKGDWHRN